MSDFKTNMYCIRFGLGLRPRPHWGSIQRSPDPLPGFKSPTSRGWERKGSDGEEGRGLYPTPNISLKSAPLCESMTQTHNSRSSDL